MDNLRKAFLALPDTVIITDTFFYVLDTNRTEPFFSIKKGERLTAFMPDCEGITEDECVFAGRAYRRTVTKVFEREKHVGYTVYLADITEKKRLVEENERISRELDELTKRKAQTNAELAEYARQAEEISGYSEQLRIARNIHDDSGHSLAELHTISQMCLEAKDTDSGLYFELIDKALAICERAAKKKGERNYASLTEMLELFRDEGMFEIELRITGEEPGFAKPLYTLIRKICSEAYHNTLSHSMADKLLIEVKMSHASLKFEICDNGSFRGPFEKGFGLLAMEENVLKTGGKVTFHAVEGEGFGLIIEWETEI